eukprot:TRINITY_DN1227_c0_g1_i1.p2 TRINITY_DN1227_c0_g1~~TRINITY_DN1227_c0_g1_i1.p2  ORF type:complete len:234 (-),score=62.94 TRINITY_DN1227_c0_g1_i1:158-811(-)
MALRFFRSTGRVLKFELPTLSYPVKDGIPPVISPTQMDLHFNKHHKAYVDKLNDMTKDSPLKDKSVVDVMRHAWKNRPEQQVLYNQAGQHYNHSFYWACLAPHGVALKSGSLESRLNHDFGSVDKFKEEFEAKAIANFGSGWTWLVWDSKEAKLKIINSGNAESPVVEDHIVPVITCDVWEHAYYVDYQNRRPEYLKSFWRILNWEFADSNLPKEAR